LPAYPRRCFTSTSALICLIPFVLFSCSAAHPDLHSFPTRRSSDLSNSSSTRSEHYLSGHCVFQGSGTRPPAWTTSIVWTSVACGDRKSTRLNSSHVSISYAVFCLKKKKQRSLWQELCPHRRIKQ